MEIFQHLQECYYLPVLKNKPEGLQLIYILGGWRGFREVYGIPNLQNRWGGLPNIIIFFITCAYDAKLSPIFICSPNVNITVDLTNVKQHKITQKDYASVWNSSKLIWIIWVSWSGRKWHLRPFSGKKMLSIISRHSGPSEHLIFVWSII